MAMAQTVLDQANLECHYDYTYLKDTLKNEISNDRLVLLVGSKISKCYSYYSIQVDSIMSKPNWYDVMHNALNRAFATKSDYPHKRMKTYIYKNYPDGKMTVTDGVTLQDYIYEDSMNNINWMIEDSTKTILDYTVQMATCSFRGHKWTAWFALDVPVMDGPWKFNGLPGLIMEVSDKNSYHHFKLVGIRKVSNMPIVMSKAYTGSKKFERIERSKFLKLQKQYLEDMSGMLKLETGIDLDPMASRKQLLYQPLEIE